MKTKRKYLALVLLFSALLVLSGCSGDGLSYLSALEKAKSLSSYGEKGSISFSLAATLPSEFAEEMKPMYLPSVLDAIDDVSLAYDVQYCKGNSKGHFQVRTENTVFDIDAFVSEDGTAVSEIPTLAKAYLPERFFGAEYVVLDTENRFGTANRKLFSGADMMNLTREAYSFFKSYLSEAEDLPEIVSRSGNEYTLRISDENLKSALQILTELCLTKESARQRLKAFWEELLTFYGNNYGEELAETLREETELWFFETDFKALKTETDAFFETLREVPLVGEEGIVLKMNLDKQGVPQKTELTADLQIDINRLEEMMNGQALYEEPFVISLRLNTTSEISEKNQIKHLEIPKLDRVKTVSLTEWLEEMGQFQPWDNDWEYFATEEFESLELPAADGSITVFSNGEHFAFKGAKPKLVNGSLYVPISFFSDNASVGCEVVNNKVFLYQYDRCFYAPIGSSVWETDSYSIDVRQAISETEGEIYLPLRAVWESLNLGFVDWDEASRSVYIY